MRSVCASRELAWIAIFWILAGCITKTQSNDGSCFWRKKTEEIIHRSPEIFWVNMDKSIDRRASLSSHLDQIGWLHRRIKGLSLDDIYIPSDVRSKWDQYDAVVQTAEVLVSGDDPQYITKYGNVSHFLIGLVGRGKSNRLKELGCTISHLEAMRQAIYNNRSSSKYAVITEDDIFIPFDINFQGLAEAAPKDFGILQLFNSNEESMLSVWKMYRRDQEKNTWVPNRVGQAAAFWSTCAYVINREVLRPVIDEVIFQVQQAIHVRLIAGIRKPCRPKLSFCCTHIAGTYSYEFIERPPCFIAPKGFQADSFLYTLNRTYVLTTPLITNGAGGNKSTFHQDHVQHIHQSAFKTQRSLINDMISGQAPLPSFVNKSCMSPLPLEMEIKMNFTCWYSAPARRSISVFWFYISHDQTKERYGDYIRNVVGREAKWVPWIPESSLYIPEDLVRSWETRNCRIQSSESSLQARSITPAISNSLQHVMQDKFQVAFSGLCGTGRHQHHAKHSLAATVSHLLALYQAKQKPLTETRYAIISAGAVFLALNPNFEALVSSAPENFGFLTFFITDNDLVDRLWQEYIQNPKEKIWSILHDKYLDSISSEFYIVNLDVIGPILEAIVQLQLNGDNGRPLTILRLIAAGQHHYISNRKSSSSQNTAGVGNEELSNTPSTSLAADMKESVAAGPDSKTSGSKSGCYPSECCGDEKDDRRPLYCVFAGSHRMESFLWKIAPTYTFHIPMVLRGTYDPTEGYIPSGRSDPVFELSEINNSTDGHSTRIRGKANKYRGGKTASSGGVAVDERTRQILKTIQDGQTPLPPFLLSSCSFKF
jgi:GR25 family glycosyltransferase involved in LPS biosynthesis